MLPLSTYEDRKLNEAGLEVAALVIFGPKSGPSLMCCSGTSNLGHDDPQLLDAVQNVESVGPIELAIDPITRKTQVSRCEIRLVDDGALRTFGSLYNLNGARVVIRLCPIDRNGVIGEGLIGCWRGAVEDIVPGDGFVTVHAGDALRLAGDVEFHGYFRSRHPLEGVLEMLRAMGLPDELIDLDAFVPANHPEISHLVMQYTGPTGESDQRGAQGGLAIEHIEAMGVQCGGSTHVNELGKATFKAYSEPTSVHDTWDDQDILDLQVLQTYEGMINEVHVDFGRGEWSGSYIRRDNRAQSDHADADATVRVSTLKVEMPFAGAVVTVVGESGDGPLEAGDATFELLGPLGPIGFSGSRVSETFRDLPDGTVFGDIDPFTQPEGATIAGARPAYLQIEDEIVRITDADIATTVYRSEAPEIDRNGRPNGLIGFHPTRMEASVFERGYGITSEATHVSQIGYDITPAVRWATILLNRCRNGLPKLRVRTTLGKFKYEVGDFVEVEHDDFFWWGTDGLNSTNAIWWELTKKKLDLIGGWIEWELTFAKIATPQSTADPEDEARDPDRTFVGGPAAWLWGISPAQDETITASAANYGVKWNSEVPFASENGPGEMDESTGEWTCNVGGMHTITAQVGFSKGDEPDAAQIRIQVGGGDIVRGGWDYPGTEDLNLSASVNYPLLPGQVVSVVVRMYVAGGGVVQISSGAATRLSITRVGAAL